ncbi:MAG: hypothetical protein [Bacteriophage sp.]|nr:MAG: hypothetical protein [Bacteriophage sp.]
MLLQKLLHLSINLFGLSSKITIAISQLLDKKIVKKQRKKIDEKRNMMYNEKEVKECLSYETNNI